MLPHLLMCVPDNLDGHCNKRREIESGGQNTSYPQVSTQISIVNKNKEYNLPLHSSGVTEYPRTLLFQSLFATYPLGPVNVNPFCGMRPLNSTINGPSTEQHSRDTKLRLHGFQDNFPLFLICMQ